MIKELYNDFKAISKQIERPQWMYIQDVINDCLIDRNYNTHVGFESIPKTGDILKVTLDTGEEIGPFVIK